LAQSQRLGLDLGLGLETFGLIMFALVNILVPCKSSRLVESMELHGRLQIKESNCGPMF